MKKVSLKGKNTFLAFQVFGFMKKFSSNFRTFINMYECIQLAIHGEIVFPEWILNLIHFNHFALVINSSINILIYCWRDKKFLHIMLVTCRIRTKDPLPMTAHVRASSGRRIRLREEEHPVGNSFNGSRNVTARHVQIELKPITSEHGSERLLLKPEPEKKEELKICMISYSGKETGLVAGNWIDHHHVPKLDDDVEEEEESCKCSCGYASESPSCCSYPEEVISKSGKMSAATQIPSKD